MGDIFWLIDCRPVCVCMRVCVWMNELELVWMNARCTWQWANWLKRLCNTCLCVFLCIYICKTYLKKRIHYIIHWYDCNRQWNVMKWNIIIRPMEILIEINEYNLYLYINYYIIIINIIYIYIYNICMYMYWYDSNPQWNVIKWNIIIMSIYINKWIQFIFIY